MRVAAYQAPYLPFGSLDAVGLIATEVERCVAAGVDILCCPEAVVGGLAHEGDGQSPADVALGVADGELATVIAPVLTTSAGTSLTVIVGFTERGSDGGIYNAAAVVADGAVAGVYRKVYPGYRTVIRAGDRLPVFRHGSTTFGVIICNDLWYVEPARVLAASGAAIVFVPTNSGHRREPSASFRARGDNLPVARAVENTTTVVVADIAGHDDGRIAYGFSAVIDPDGIVLARAEPFAETLLVADVEPDRRPYDPRGVDGHTNPAVTRAFLDLWDRPSD